MKIDHKDAAKIYDLLVKHCNIKDTEQERTIFVRDVAGRGVSQYNLIDAGLASTFCNDGTWGDLPHVALTYRSDSAVADKIISVNSALKRLFARD
ncbi:MAG: hypothetical protein EOP83_02045 [Verrucomicrobiaceae bacterium]|nr:MAG: hypothetical protein EOP83_02045 [Verrucomicrobiaceae bacterium]